MTVCLGTPLFSRLLLSCWVLIVLCAMKTSSTTTLTNDDYIWTLHDDTPPPRSGHIFEKVSATTAIMGFGRYSGTLLNDVWRYNTSTHTWMPLYPGGSSPTPRGDACGVVVGDGLYVYGGLHQLLFDELWVLNLTTQRWVVGRPTLGTVWPPPTWYCQLKPYRDGIALIFGQDVSQVIFYYSISMGKWSEVRTKGLKGIQPIDRVQSCCANMQSNPDRTVCYGGWGNKSLLSDFWELDHNTNTWASPPVVSTSPSARYYHSCYSHPRLKRYYIFGGCDTVSCNFKDLWMYDFQTQRWSMITDTGSGLASVSGTSIATLGEGGVSFGGQGDSGRYVLSFPFDEPDSTKAVQVLRSKKRPSPRQGHVMVTMGSYVYVVFGGNIDSAGSVRFPPDTVWRLDPTPDQMTWLELNTDAPDLMHATGLVKGLEMFIVFGRLGDTTFSNDVLHWMPTIDRNKITVIQQASGTTRPPSRGDAAVSFFDVSLELIIVFGGVNATSTMNDIWVFHIASRTWLLVTNGPGDQPSPRYGARFAMTANGLYLLYGSGSDNLEISEQWSLTIIRNANVTDTTDVGTAVWRSLPARYTDDILWESGLRQAPVVVSSPTSSLVFITEGYYDDTAYNNDILFDTETETNVYAPRPPWGRVMRYVGATHFRGRWLFFGGANQWFIASAMFWELSLRGMNCTEGSKRNEITHECDLCEMGTYGKMSQCVDCPGGTYGNEVGLVGPTTCTPCDPTTYQNASRSTSCIPCTKDQWCPVGSIYPGLLSGDVNDGPAKDIQPQDQTTSGLSTTVIYTITGCATSALLALILAIVFSNVHHFHLTRNKDDCTLAVRNLRDLFMFIGSDGRMTFPQMLVMLTGIMSDDALLPDDETLLEKFTICSQSTDVIRFTHIRRIITEILEDGYSIDPMKIGIESDDDATVRLELDSILLKTPFHFLTFDSFGVVHDGLGALVRVRSTNMGGIISIFSYIVAVTVAALLTLDFSQNNIIETRSSLPSFLAGSKNFTSDVTVKVRFEGTPGGCDCQRFVLRDLIGVDYDVGASTKNCFSPREDQCEVQITLLGLSVQVDASVTLEAVSSNFYATKITVEVSSQVAGSSEDSDLSFSSLLVEPSSPQSLFRGRNKPTIFYLQCYPTSLLPLSGTRTYGYVFHILQATPGDEVSSRLLHTVSGLRVQISLVLQTQSGLTLNRRNRLTVIDFISNLTSIIPSAIQVCGIIYGIMFMIRRSFLRKKAKMVRKNAMVHVSATLTSPVDKVPGWNPLEGGDASKIVSWIGEDSCRVLALCNQGLSFHEAVAIVTTWGGMNVSHPISLGIHPNIVVSRSVREDERNANMEPIQHDLEMKTTIV